MRSRHPILPVAALGNGVVHQVPREQWLEDRIGAECLKQAYACSLEMSVPLPVLGAGAFLYRGSIFPVMAGGAGFTSLSDLIDEATVGGKLQYLYFNKVGVTGVANRASTLWYEGTVPGVGATAAALAAGTNFDRASTGAIGPQKNAAGGDTLHLLGAEGNITVQSQGLLLYDRIWAGEPVVTTTTAQTVTMTATRYATTGAAGTSKGNMVFVEVRVTLGAATPTCTLQYVDDLGNAAENAPTLVGITAALAKTFPFTGVLSFPLNAGDAGVSDITEWTNTPSWVSGNIALVLAHPLMYIPGIALSNAGYIRDGINSAFNFQRVYDDACLALVEPIKAATTATSYSGFITACSG